MKLTSAQKALVFFWLRVKHNADFAASEAESEALRAVLPPVSEADALQWRLGIAKQQWLNGDYKLLRELLGLEVKKSAVADPSIDLDTALDIARFLARVQSTPPTRARRDYVSDKPVEAMRKRAWRAVEQDVRAIVEEVTGKKRGIEEAVVELAASHLGVTANVLREIKKHPPRRGAKRRKAKPATD
jgi:hypothetical protein